MADQVHPHDSPPAGHLAGPPSEKPVPPPGTYVIQIPKDQVYRVPPPENSRRYEQLTRRKPRRNSCCRCLCFLLSFIVVLILLLGAAAGIFYLVFRPESPSYTVTGITFSGLNLTSAGAISPAMAVSVRANNPNNKIGIYYLNNSDVNVYYTDVKLCDGVLPPFYQPSNNVTVFKTTLNGAGLKLSQTVRRGLIDAQTKGRVPLKLNIRAPVKIKVGSVKTWEITVKVNCDLTVDKLTAGSKIVNKECDYGVNLW